MLPLINGLSLHILVVENELQVYAPLKAALEYDGYRVAFTAEKAAAMALLSSVKVDLVIADVGLPDGLGTEVVEHATTLGVPSIMMTGHPQYMAELDNEGVTYIAKPFRIKKFREQVKDRLKAVAAVS